MVILTMAKFLGNLRKDSILSLFDTTNIIFCLGSLFASKMPLVNFFWDTCYVSFASRALKRDQSYLPSSICSRDIDQTWAISLGENR